MRVLLSVLVLLALTGCASLAPEPGTARVTGEALYLERIAVPPDVRLEVVLEDISRADAPAERIGEVTIRDAGQPPYPFTIEYDAGQIDPRHSYRLAAGLYHGEDLLFVTDEVHQVITRGFPSEATLRLRRVEGGSDQAKMSSLPATLKNTYWRLALLGSEGVLRVQNQREPHLVFHEDGRVAGSDGCNMVSGAYTTDGSKVTLSRLASTRKACLKGMEQAKKFLDTLDTITSYRIIGQHLEMLDGSGKLQLRFEMVALP